MSSRVCASGLKRRSRRLMYLQGCSRRSRRSKSSVGPSGARAVSSPKSPIEVERCGRRPTVVGHLYRPCIAHDSCNRKHSSHLGSKPQSKQSRKQPSMVSLAEVAIVRVEAPWMKQPLDLSSWHVVLGKRFVKLSKMDPKISRLLLGEAPAKKRALTDTSIVEDLIKLRNAAVDKEVLANHAASTARAEEDLGVGTSQKRPDAKRRKIIEESLPPVLVIDVPGVGGGDGRAMSVLTASGQTAVSIELVAENIDFLHMVAEAQSSSKSEDAVEQKEAKEVSGVWWYPQKKAWRVKFAAEGKQKYKFFKPSNPEDPSDVRNAEVEARAFAMSQR